MAPLIVICGETASGKSSLAMRLAELFNGEIICADSWTVRREVTIGTAKPTSEDQLRIPHHLIDIVGPDEDFTAAVFKGLALAVISDISSRGKLPIMVGGTGLYIDSVIYNYGFLPEGDRSQREQWNSRTLSELREEVNKREIDTAGIDLHNKRRLIRLLETDGQRPSKEPVRQNTLLVGLTVPRDVLKNRIEARVTAMIEAGLEQEVRSLSLKYGWDCEALKGIGYKEWNDYFTGRATEDETKQRIIKSTQDLAKRQRTWFKRNSSIQYINDPSEAVDIVTTFLNKKQ